MKILLADDHTIVRKGIKMILEDVYKDVFIQEAANGLETITESSKQKWDIVISDFSMPGISGIPLIRNLRQILPKTPILILSNHEPGQYAEHTMIAGANGFLSKNNTPENLIKTVGNLCDDKKNTTEKNIDKSLEAYTDQTSVEKTTALTLRELEVLKYLGKGKTEIEISQYMGICLRFTRHCEDTIFEKMGFKNRADLKKYCTENELR